MFKSTTGAMKISMVGGLGMSEGYTALQNMISRLRELGQSAETIAADIAPELRAELEKNISAGIAPDGTPWEPTLTGEKALKNAGSALGVAAVGSKVIVVLSGIEARHNYGHVKGGKVRQIVPAEITDQIRKIIIETANKRFRMIMGGK